METAELVGLGEGVEILLVVLQVLESSELLSLPREEVDFYAELLLLVVVVMEFEYLSSLFELLH